jgi:thioredoxin 1
MHKTPLVLPAAFLFAGAQSAKSCAFPGLSTRRSFHRQLPMEFDVGQLVSDADFADEVLKAKEPVLVDFWADWCPPCKAMDPILEELAVELEGRVKIVKLDVETNPSTVVTYNVRAMPTLMVFKGGEPVDIKVGYGPSRAQLTKWLESYA